MRDIREGRPADHVRIQATALEHLRRSLDNIDGLGSPNRHVASLLGLDRLRKLELGLSTEFHAHAGQLDAVHQVHQAAGSLRSVSG